MKKIVLFTFLLFQVLFIQGQRSIDRLFDRYGGRDGFTTITISGDLLKFAAEFENDENDINARISEIRILAEDDDNPGNESFHDLVIKDLDLGQYEEFMRVKEDDQDMRMLVRTEGRRIREFLLISGGTDNLVVQVKGDMTLSDAKKLSEDVIMGHGNILE